MQELGLDWKNGNHEIVAESGVAEEAAVFRVPTSDAADEGSSTEDDDDRRNHQVHGHHGAEFDPRAAGSARFEVGINPLRASPEKTEAGLDGGAVVGFRGGDLVEQ